MRPVVAFLGAPAEPLHFSNLDRPQYLISPSSASSAPSSSSSRPPPPAAAFGPSLRILKRPTGGSGSGSRSPTPTAGSEAERKEGLAKREKAYQEARKRIFGGSDGATVGGEDDKERRKEGVETVRSPRGPEDGTAGFRGRGRGRGRGKGTS